jgi:hypothetical protein
VNAGGRLFPLGLGPLCGTCPVIGECGAEETEHACPPDWGRPGWGGEEVLHPARLDALEHVESLKGLRLSAFKARRVEVPELPGYIPQCRWRNDLVGRLEGPVYALRPKAIFRKAGIRTADEVRAHFRLSPTQQLVLLLFDHDPWLERLHEPEAMSELASAGYDLVISASYSIWSPRPRMHQLYNLVRSLALCVALQKHDVPAVPRVDWTIERDVTSWASWLEENQSVEMVALDAQTSRDEQSWQQLLAGLNRLDRETGGRLHYLINGPTREARWAEVYLATAPSRVTFTDASLHHGTPPTAQERIDFSAGNGKVDRGLIFLERAKRREEEIERAQLRAA